MLVPIRFYESLHWFDMLLADCIYDAWYIKQNILTKVNLDTIM